MGTCSFFSLMHPAAANQEQERLMCDHYRIRQTPPFVETRFWPPQTFGSSQRETAKNTLNCPPRRLTFCHCQLHRRCCSPARCHPPPPLHPHSSFCCSNSGESDKGNNKWPNKSDGAGLARPPSPPNPCRTGLPPHPPHPLHLPHLFPKNPN